MTSSEKMSFDKTPALYTTNIPFDEDLVKKRKVCSKTLLTGLLALVLVSLCVFLTVEFLFPFEKKDENIDEVHIYDGEEINVKVISHNTEDWLEDKAPWHLDFLINPTRLCETVNPPDSDAYFQDPEVKLLMLVPSATGHFDQRRAIRRTWGSVAQEPHGPMRLGFVLGTTPNATETELIEKESVSFGDIIQADFEDSHRNLTTKSVLMLKWVSEHCAHATYFLKADDDTFVNLHVIAQILQKDPYQTGDKFIGGYIQKEPFRLPNEKYYVAAEAYPGQQYPPFASGAAYVSTGPTAAQLFEASKKAKPFLSPEDIFVTGLCADDIDAKLFHEPSFILKEPPRPISWDSYKSVAAAHSMTPEDIEQIWSEMTKSIFDSIGLFDFPFAMSLPGENIFLSSDSGPSLSDYFLLPERNSDPLGMFDRSESSAISQFLNWPGEKIFSSISSDSWMDSKKSDLFPGSFSKVFSFPETDIYNLTFFSRK